MRTVAARLEAEEPEAGMECGGQGHGRAKRAEPTVLVTGAGLQCGLGARQRHRDFSSPPDGHIDTQAGVP